jgi:hypothetical protein
MSMKMNFLIENVLEGSITDAVRDVVGKMWPEKRSELQAFTDALMVKLGLRLAGAVLLTGTKTQVIELGGGSGGGGSGGGGSGSDSDEKADDAVSTDSASGNAAPAEPKAASERKRTVSKKMKDEFAGAGGDEKQLKAAMKAYKAATDEQVAVGWAAFSAPFRGAAVAAVAAAAPATPPKAASAAAEPAPAAPAAPVKEKKPRAKSEKNFSWTPSAKKLFAETVEASGGTVSDLLKDRFAAHVNALAPEDYKVLAAVGHMRKFLTAPAPPADEPASAPAAAADDDEDMESFEFEGEELFIGVTSGKIYRQTETAGDQLIGVAGTGRFKDVKKPE